MALGASHKYEGRAGAPTKNQRERYVNHRAGGAHVLLVHAGCELCSKTGEKDVRQVL